jgi:hypothetical protein
MTIHSKILGEQFLMVTLIFRFSGEKCIFWIFLKTQSLKALEPQQINLSAY